MNMLRFRSRALAVGVVGVTAAAIALVAAQPAAAKLPPGAKQVPVSPTGTRSGVGATLHPSAEIEGRVTLVGSATPVANATISAFDSKGREVASGDTDNLGDYHLFGLFEGKYRVCSVDPIAPNGVHPFGIATGCAGTAQPLAGGEPPASARKVEALIGSPTTVDLRVADAGGITGVAKSSGGKKLGNVVATAFTADGQVAGTVSSSDGTYRIVGLAPGSYRVCFAGLGNRTVDGATGALPQCYKHKSWSGGSVPSGAKKITVRSGAAHHDVNSRLHHGAAIAGQVLTSGHGKPLHGSVVTAFDGKRFAGSAETNGHGKFTIRGLAGGSYKVCADGGSNSASAATGEDCAHGVSAHAGSTHRHVHLKLPARSTATGAVSGTVTGRNSDGTDVGLGDVEVFATGAAGTVSGDTQPDGSYRLSGLPIGKYTVCFETLLAQPQTGNPPTGGFANECAGDAAWAGGTAPPPAGASKIHVRAHSTITGVGADIGPGGAISGIVHVQDGGADEVTVEVFDPKGHNIVDTSVVANNAYVVDGLTAGKYVVCFEALFETGDTPTNGVGYLPQCYKDQTWLNRDS